MSAVVGVGAGALAVALSQPGVWVVAVLAAVVAAICLGYDGLSPRSVSGDRDGLTVRSRWRTWRVPWTQLRRTRRPPAGTFPVDGDVLVERADGSLLPLPGELPGGTVERWRAQVGGGRPADDLPQTWRRPDPGVRMWPIWMLPLVGQLVLRLRDPEREWPLILALLVMTLVAAGALVLSLGRPSGVTVDRDGLVVHDLRRRRIAWSDVQEIHAVARYDSTAVLVLDDGGTRQLPSVPADVAEQWRALARSS